MGRTKIVGPAGRFGARYGATLRKRVALIERKMKSKHRCPFCYSLVKMKRLSIGVWQCPKCEKIFAGGAWVPKTVVGKTLAPEEEKLAKGRIVPGTRPKEE
ncbi:MAG: 50S ribosomal protein L37ae [Thermoprotei archaeon]|nr:MAG: 50S ribosomal protein L37ae [Thermoprotei archaeon]RLF01094.1 MAG: 50S ribosomal protein L37ae [Thermoprotei archaeon]HDI75248.1 50S ribosomal protein L37ae [Thermoprotei archaeon]